MLNKLSWFWIGASDFFWSNPWLTLYVILQKMMPHKKWLKWRLELHHLLQLLVLYWGVAIHLSQPWALCSQCNYFWLWPSCCSNLSMFDYVNAYAIWSLVICRSKGFYLIIFCHLLYIPNYVVKGGLVEWYFFMLVPWTNRSWVQFSLMKLSVPPFLLFLITLPGSQPLFITGKIIYQQTKYSPILGLIQKF